MNFILTPLKAVIAWIKVKYIAEFSLEVGNGKMRWKIINVKPEQRYRMF